MDRDVSYRNPQSLYDAVPHLDGPVEVPTSEGEGADHLKAGEVATVANQLEIVRANARLEGSVTPAIRVPKSGFEVLHPAADEQRRVVGRNH
jgi:hypothetical protein